MTIKVPGIKKEFNKSKLLLLLHEECMLIVEKEKMNI